MKSLWRKFLAWLNGEMGKRVELDPTPAPTGCGCDLSGERIPPAQFGSQFECPVPWGLDVRFLCWHPGRRDWVFIPRPVGVNRDGNDITATCPASDLHLLEARAPSVKSVPVPAVGGAVRIPYMTTTRLYYERRAR